MDRERFDAIARLLAARGSRRGAMGALLGVALLGRSPDEVIGKGAKRRKRSGKGNKTRRGGEPGTGAAGTVAELDIAASEDAGEPELSVEASPKTAELEAAPQPAAASRRRKGKGKGKGKGNGKQQRPPARSSPAQAEAANCCGTKSCAKPAKGKNLQSCVYAGQDLSGTNGSGANMQGVDGRKTIFSSAAKPANWTGAGFYRACLQGSTWHKATLHGANFDQACLFDADLSSAKVNSSTSTASARFCRTKLWDGTVSDRDCGKATACCAACDAQRACPNPDDQVCCDGRCQTGDCCAARDCPDRLCETRSCQANTCRYAPVSGKPGPQCAAPRICCEDAQGKPFCCDDGVKTCDADGQCCVPDCDGRECGGDGCGGSCPPGCPQGQTCDKGGQCVIACGQDACDPETEVCCGGVECVSGICCQLGDACLNQAECCDTPANETNCVGGVCCVRKDAACQPGQCCGDLACCGDGGGKRCVDTDNDDDNCGACGTVCPEHASCVTGACACDDGFKPCGELCIPKAQCCTGTQQGCADPTPNCCVTEGNGVCRDCCDDADCTDPAAPVCNANFVCVPCDDDTAPCNTGEVCCAGECFAGTCCERDDCVDKICQNKRCGNAHVCNYVDSINGKPGPLCEGTVCCGGACCDGGQLCDTRPAKAVCCTPTKTTCDVGVDCGNVPDGCGGTVPCGDCPPETCFTVDCTSHTCDYDPVFGTTGQGCQTTVCCRDAQGDPVCCDAGITVCTASGRCRCTGDGDCAADAFCCDGACIADDRCCDGNASTCPDPGVCHVRACDVEGDCAPQPVTNGTDPNNECPGNEICCNGACAACCGSDASTCAPRACNTAACDGGACVYTASDIAGPCAGTSGICVRNADGSGTCVISNDGTADCIGADPCGEVNAPRQCGATNGWGEGDCGCYSTPEGAGLCLRRITAGPNAFRYPNSAIGCAADAAGLAAYPPCDGSAECPAGSVCVSLVGSGLPICCDRNYGDSLNNQGKSGFCVIVESGLCAAPPPDV